MPFLETICCKCGDRLFDEAYEVLKRHFGYLLDYKKNLKNLEDAKKELEKQQEKINDKFKEATTRGEDILDDVSEWFNNANSKKQEFDQFMDKKTRKENIQCFSRFSFPNFMGRYQLSKQAQEMKVNVKKFTDEGKFDTVSRPKHPPIETGLPFAKDFQRFKSRDQVFSSIVDALTDSKVKIVGVYGQGGVGKTTIVQKVGEYVKINGLFDEVVVAVVSRPQNVRDIQKQIAGGLYPKLVFDLDSDQKERAGQLMNRLNNGKKNLIIFDDIWENLEDLNVIGIPITDGNKGCKLVLTSRDRNNWKHMRGELFREFQIDILSESEAWELFKKKVGNSVGDELLYPVAQKVCQECGRLPLAISAVGAALKDRDLYAWNNALTMLKKYDIEGIDPKLYTSLKLSYDLLQFEDAKSIFLLCCLFPEDADISIDEDLTMHCVARRLLLLDKKPPKITLEQARDAVRTAVGTLKTSCLLLKGKDKRYVKMHDVIRDVAVSICQPILVKDGIQEWPEKGMYSAMLLRNARINELPDELECPQLHTLQLYRSYMGNDPLLTVPDNFFSAMENLNILDLHRICMPSSSSLTKLVNLRMLCLIGCELTDASILKDLKKSLEILILGGEANHLLPKVGQLIHLRLLDLRRCNDLKVIPRSVISKLTHLEELYIPDSCDQWEGTTADDMERSNASLDDLSSLTRLTCLYIHIPNVATLPKDFRGFQKLIRFQISVGEEFKYFETNNAATTFLKLSGITLEDDQFSDLLDRAEVLCLEKLHGLKELIHNKGGMWFFKGIKYLTVKSCHDLVYLLSSSWAIGTPQLQYLEIKDCQIIEKIVGIEEGKDGEELTNKVVNFSHLKYMKLEKLPSLISFYLRMKKIERNSSSCSHPLFNEKVTFPTLEELNIKNVPNIREIWDEKLPPEIAAKTCPKLTVMNVSECEKCVHVVPSTMLSLLQEIRKLQVRYCEMMEVIISDKATEKKPFCNDVIVFHQLRTLSLVNLPNLKSFCNSLTTSEAPLTIFNHRVAFPALEELNILVLRNFIMIWDEQLLPVAEKEAASYPMLTVMSVYNCHVPVF